MVEIKSIHKKTEYDEACVIIHRSQKAESESTGVLFNTINITSAELEENVENSNGMCFCAFDDNKIVGTLCVFPDEKTKWYSNGQICKTIKYVAVSPESQGKHIGSTLLDHVKAMTDYQVLNVSTGELNRNAIRFYKKNGFVLVDISRGPIHNAYKMAYWKDKCQISKSKIKRHVFIARIKCFVKKLILGTTAKEELFR